MFFEDFTRLGKHLTAQSQADFHAPQAMKKTVSFQYTVVHGYFRLISLRLLSKTQKHVTVLGKQITIEKLIFRQNQNQCSCFFKHF